MRLHHDYSQGYVTATDAVTSRLQSMLRYGYCYVTSTDNVSLRPLPRLRYCNSHGFVTVTAEVTLWKQTRLRFNYSHDCNQELRWAARLRLTSTPTASQKYRTYRLFSIAIKYRLWGLQRKSINTYIVFHRLCNCKFIIQQWTRMLHESINQYVVVMEIYYSNTIK